MRVIELMYPPGSILELDIEEPEDVLSRVANLPTDPAARVLYLMELGRDAMMRPYKDEDEWRVVREFCEDHPIVPIAVGKMIAEPGPAPEGETNEQ